eukprot:gb/GEZN01005481.1/.p1 GENE.gb/GEZN01005481.1/~~gb/GEZN01005481.1/.p1  ORF type:complete len:460 (+),score=83.19 gb/GEZN01005481.1/:78-1382(+)
MLTVTDFMHVLLALHEKNDGVTTTSSSSPSSSASLASVGGSSATGPGSLTAKPNSSHRTGSRTPSPPLSPKSVAKLSVSGAARIKRSFSRDRIHDWNEFKQLDGIGKTSLHWIGPEDTLLAAVLKLRRNRIHRLCVMQLALDTVLYVLSQNAVIILLLRELKALPKRHNEVTLRQLNIHHSLNKQYMMTYRSSLADAFRALKSARCSSVPICDEYGVLLDCFSRNDLKCLSLVDLDLSKNLQDVVSQRKKGEKVAHQLLKCKLDVKLEDMMETLEAAARQNASIFVLDEKDRVLGVVSGEHLLSFVVSEELSTMSAHLSGGGGGSNSGLTGGEDGTSTSRLSGGLGETQSPGQSRYQFGGDSSSNINAPASSRVSNLSEEEQSTGHSFDSSSNVPTGAVFELDGEGSEDGVPGVRKKVKNKKSAKTSRSNSTSR